MSKTYADTYLFKTYKEYEKAMLKFIVNAERIDTNGAEFEDILYDVKRRKVSDSLAKIITSNNVVIGYQQGMPLPKAFKSFVAKDIKEDKNKTKVFIDVTDCISFKDGTYVCTNINWFISYVIMAMTNYIYAMAENRICGNASILKDGGEAFTAAFGYTIDRLLKISSVRDLRERVIYAIALYYQVCLMGKDLDKQYDSIKANAIKIADINPKSAQIVDVMLKPEDFVNISTFTECLRRVFKFNTLTVDSIVSTWMTAFGTGTVLALEYMPAFCRMMTNTYINGNIDRDATIEKVCSNAMVKTAKTILQIGGTAV